ncbi:hypothetical protein TruAng_002209 [Truncatella angustata]|nr:hypothetical protein TruAng_002209 [Truncatella angustata]
MTITRPRRIRRQSNSLVSEQERLARRAQKERIQALEAAVAMSASTGRGTWTQSEDVLGTNLLSIKGSAETAFPTSGTTATDSSNFTNTLYQPLLDLNLDPRLTQSLGNGHASCPGDIFGGYAFQASHTTTTTVAAAAAAAATNNTTTLSLSCDHYGEENHQAESAPAMTTEHTQTEDISNLNTSPAFDDAEATVSSSEGIDEASAWSHSADNYMTHAGGYKSDNSSIHEQSAHSPLATPRNHKDKRCTALHIAALAGDSCMVELLLDRGADAGLLNKGGQTPLHLAVIGAAEAEKGFGGRHSCANNASNGGGDKIAKEAEKTVRLLLRALGAGADRRPGALDKSGRSVLFTAITTGSEAIVQMVLDALGDESVANGSSSFHSDSNGVESDARHAGIRAALQVPDARGTLPLHWAVASGSVSMVRLLLSNGADINQ